MKIIKDQVVPLALRILQAVAVSLGLEPQFFTAMHKKMLHFGNQSKIRALFYPPIEGGTNSCGDVVCSLQKKTGLFRRSSPRHHTLRRACWLWHADVSLSRRPRRSRGQSAGWRLDRGSPRGGQHSRKYTLNSASDQDCQIQGILSGAPAECWWTPRDLHQWTLPCHQTSRGNSRGRNPPKTGSTVSRLLHPSWWRSLGQAHQGRGTQVWQVRVHRGWWTCAETTCSYLCLLRVKYDWYGEWKNVLCTFHIVSGYLAKITYFWRISIFTEACQKLWKSYILGQK